MSEDREYLNRLILISLAVCVGVAAIVLLSGCSTLGNGKLDLDLDQIAKYAELVDDPRVNAIVGILNSDENDTAAPVGVAVSPQTKGKKPFQPGILLPKYPVFIEGNCTKGGAIVQVNHIPVMTDANKDELNKTLLFGLASRDGTNFMGVYHRYLQPDWPHGEWWSTWRFEAGHCNCIEEWHIFQSQPLPGQSARFEIAWDGNTVRVKHSGTNDEQILHTQNRNAFEDIVTDIQCYSERPSTAAAILKTWNCLQGGSPGDCGK